MKRSLLPAAAAVAGLAAVALPPSATAATARPKCTTAGTTIAASADVRVYTRGRTTDDPVYACASKSGKRFLISPGNECESGMVRSVAFAGHYLAAEIGTCGAESESETIALFDVKQRKLIRRGLAISNDFSSVSGISSYVLAPNGSVAYISITGGNTLMADLRVITRSGDDRDAPTILDSGSELVPESLALAPSGTIYWQNGQTLKSAKL